jgi:hypothetical protein
MIFLIIFGLLNNESFLTIGVIPVKTGISLSEAVNKILGYIEGDSCLRRNDKEKR